MSSSQATLPSIAELMQTHFHLAMGHHDVVAIKTDGLFDMHKIQDLYRVAGTDLVEVKMSRRAQAILDTKVIGTPHQLVPPQPANNEHYLFKKTATPRRLPIDMFPFEDVFLSYDVRNKGNGSFYFINKKKEPINRLFCGGLPLWNQHMKRSLRQFALRMIPS
jgi:hypothetical protein